MAASDCSCRPAGQCVCREVGLEQTLHTLDHLGIRHAGAGSSLAHAMAPAVISLKLPAVPVPVDTASVAGKQAAAAAAAERKGPGASSSAAGSAAAAGSASGSGGSGDRKAGHESKPQAVGAGSAGEGEAASTPTMPLRVGFFSATDHPSNFAASATKPGEPSVMHCDCRVWLWLSRRARALCALCLQACFCWTLSSPWATRASWLH